MRTCTHCETTLTESPRRGRPSKFCGKACSRAHYKAINTRTCEVEGCVGKHLARGLCGTHYNRTLPNRHKAKTVECVSCGLMVVRSGGGGRRYGSTCSDECRLILTFGVRSELPPDHWARWYGATCAWKAPKPKPPTFQVGNCNECDAAITQPAHETPARWCSIACARRVRKRTRRAREHNAPGNFRLSQVMRQYAAQGHVCAYCHRPAKGMPEPEHVTPLSRGGRNDMGNIVAACRACNGDKNDLTLEEWEQDRKRRGLEPVDTALASEPYQHLYRTEPTASAWRNRAA